MSKRHQSFIAIFLTLLVSQYCFAEGRMVWLAYSDNRSDYFQPGDEVLHTSGGSVGFSIAISDTWSAALSYGELEGEGVWELEETDLAALFNRVQLETESGSISVDWDLERYRLSFSYSEANYSERTLTRRPFNYEEIEGKDRFISVSYADSLEKGGWLYGWRIGSQYFNGRYQSREILVIGSPLRIITDTNRTGWSAFLDIDVSHWMEHESFSWAPQFALGWNVEVSVEGEPLSETNREGDRRILAQLNDRRAETMRAMGSRYWEQSFIFDWHNNWSASIAFGRSISSVYRVGNVSLDVNVVF